MLKIRRSRDRLIYNTRIPILVRHLFTETATGVDLDHVDGVDSLSARVLAEVGCFL